VTFPDAADHGVPGRLRLTHLTLSQGVRFMNRFTRRLIDLPAASRPGPLETQATGKRRDSINGCWQIAREIGGACLPAGEPVYRGCQ
jgi:hypothetical protein